MRHLGRYDYRGRKAKLKRLLNVDNLDEAICHMYLNENLSCEQINERFKSLGVEITTRSVQRLVKRNNIMRSPGDSFRLAVSQGRVKWAYKDPRYKNRRKDLPDKLRFSILQRDNFKCRLCGETSATTILEVDHLFPINKGGKNEESNLQTLCHSCNIGKGSN